MQKPIIPEKILSCIPFEGFYESLYSSEVDHLVESDSEYQAEKILEETGLIIDPSDITEARYYATQYHGAYLDTARLYVSMFSDIVKEETELDLNLEYESMSSPKEYNFTTDRIFAFIPFKIAAAMLRPFRKGQSDELKNRVKERFTSRDGFCSFYSNDVSTWLEKPLQDWDHNEVETLLEATLIRLGLDIEDSEFRFSVFENVSGAMDSIVDDNTEWPKFEEKLEELKDAKREELGELDNGNPYNMETLPRCPATLPLFAL